MTGNGAAGKRTHFPGCCGYWYVIHVLINNLPSIVILIKLIKLSGSQIIIIKTKHMRVEGTWEEGIGRTMKRKREGNGAEMVKMCYINGRNFQRT